MVLSILLLYIAILMPFRLAFYEIVWYDAWTVVELGVDGLFIIDMFVNILSSYVNQENQLERKWTSIAWSYIKGWLILDLFACIPFGLIERYAMDSSDD